MSEELVIRQGSPTLAGLKTGNLFTAAYSDRQEIYRELRQLNRILVPKGLRILPFRYSQDRVLLYLFRPARLKQDLSQPKARQLLAREGYAGLSIDGCLIRLIERVKESNEFPHEIGLFLGYPPEDVAGFMEQGAKNYKCVGCWKVYGDAEKAISLFKAYKRCTAFYCRQWAAGKSLDRLTVAASDLFPVQQVR